MKLTSLGSERRALLFLVLICLGAGLTGCRERFPQSTLATTYPSADSSVQTLDEVLARYLVARGGREKVMALQAVRFTGTVSSGSDVMSFSVTKKRPNLLRLDVTAHGLLASQAYDGIKSWQTGAVPLTKESATDLANTADFDGPLIDGAAKGYQLRLLASRSTEPFIIRITREGIEERVELDRTSFLVIHHQRGDTETGVTEYRTVDGLAFPVSMARIRGGIAQQIRVTDIETNPTIPAGFFTEKTNATH